MDKETFNKLSPESQKLWTSIEDSLKKEIAISREYGFDVKTHWKEMLASLDVEKVETE